MCKCDEQEEFFAQEEAEAQEAAQGSDIRQQEVDAIREWRRAYQRYVDLTDEEWRCQRSPSDPHKDAAANDFNRASFKVAPHIFRILGDKDFQDA